MTDSEIGFLISDICALIPVTAGIYFFKRLQTDRKILLYLFICNAMVELTNAWLAMHHKSNMWSINIYMLIEYSVLVFIFNKWAKEIFVRWLTFTGSVIFYALWIGYFTLHKTIDEPNMPAAFAESIILMLLSGFVLTALSLKTETPVFKNYRFWFAGAAFIYSAVNILLNYIFELISFDTSSYDKNIWTIHTVINIVLYFPFTYAFIMQEE